MNTRTRATLLPCILAGSIVAASCASAQMPPTEKLPPSTPAPAQSAGGAEVAVYALSRGKGVPDQTRQALGAARDLFAKMKAEGRVLDIVETRIGLEGERRICARFKNAADAAAAMQELRALATNVELFNVVSEPCAPAAKQGEEP